MVTVSFFNKIYKENDSADMSTNILLRIQVIPVVNFSTMCLLKM